ncbi:pyridoxal 5'-phosphate synthase glutaminase subunit PdxT [Candidatus Zixiibacteriota bacterium]
MNNYDSLNIGVLALQGDFKMHQKQLDKLGVKNCLVKLPEHLEKIDGLIIPGGESTTMDKLIDRFKLRQPLTDFCSEKPVYGTCAGMILLCKNIEDNQSEVKPLGLLDIDLVRTGYGRQVFSFEETINADLNGEKVAFKAAFIRAPIISRMGEQVEKLAVYSNKPILVRQKNILAASFHAELNDNTTLLEYFLKKILRTN